MKLIGKYKSHVFLQKYLLAEPTIRRTSSSELLLTVELRIYSGKENICYKRRNMRYIFSIILFVIGVWLVALNWKSFYTTYIKKEKFCSWLPIVPGIIVIFAFILLPNNKFIHLFWIGFLLDWGCLPGSLFTLYKRLKK